MPRPSYTTTIYSPSLCQDMLPSVPYATLLDAYMLGGTLWLFAVVVYSGGRSTQTHIAKYSTF